MRTSTVRQLEFDGLDGDLPSRTQAGRLPVDPASPSIVSAAVAPSTTLRVPNFGDRGEVYAVTSKLAGRMNAASISETEHQRLLDERQQLLDKFFDRSITKREQTRLEYVRWSLDRIEDAKYGSVLDILDDAVSMYENFSADVKDLLGQLATQTGRRR